MTEPSELEIRSYRSIFDFERRVYRIDTIRLNPGGIPLRGIVYALAAVGLMLVAAKLPLIGWVSGLLPWYLRDLAIPGLSATAMTLIRIEGRDFHLAALALLGFACSRRRLRALRPGAGPGPGAIWLPPPLRLLPDGSDSSLRRMRYHGPGTLAIAVAHGLTELSHGCAQRLLGALAASRGGALLITPAQPTRTRRARVQLLELASGATVICGHSLPQLAGGASGVTMAALQRSLRALGRQRRG